MNYIQIHNDLIDYIRRTTPRERLHKRNPLDFRLKSDHLYVEIHHIIPRSLGGVDYQSNLVETLPEEHIFFHMIRYHIYRKPQDAMAVRYILYDLKGERHLQNTRLSLTKQIRMGYAWMRSHSHAICKARGWQSPEGRERISESRRGRMPARDSITGQLVGDVDLNHPNVLSGQWVHHSKGRKQSAAEIAYKREIATGQNNPNASGLNEEYFVNRGIEAYKEFGIILSWRRMLELSQSRGFPWIKSLKSRFGGRSRTGYYQEVEKATGATYDSYKSRIISKQGVPLC